MWQKARVRNLETTPWWNGKEIWTTGKPYFSETLWDPIEKVFPDPQEVIATNLLGSNGCLSVVSMVDVELLGGPEAFCEDPPRIPFAEWSVQPQEERQ